MSLARKDGVGRVMGQSQLSVTYTESHGSYGSRWRELVFLLAK